MKRSVLLVALALGASVSLLSAQDPTAAAPAAPAQSAPALVRGPGRFFWHAVPPGACQRLNLTADQQKQVASLVGEFQAKLEKILTPEQLAQLKDLRPPRPGRGPGGPGGPGGMRFPNCPRGQGQPPPPPPAD